MYATEFELRPEFEFEVEDKTFQDLILPGHVVNHVYEILKVKQQIALGNRHSGRLVDFVFFLRHPELKDKIKKPATDNRYKPEWEQIFFNVVAPTLNSSEAPPVPSTPKTPGKKDTTLRDLWGLFKWFAQHSGRRR